MLQLVQIYRALALLWVLLFHAGLITRGRYGTTPINDLWEFGFAGVHLFFVVSGFIILTAHRADVGQPHRLGRYLARRLVRIYPLYWLVFLVFGGWRLMSGQLPAYDFMTNALVFHSKIKQVVQVSWTLAHEMVFYLFFALLILSRVFGGLILCLWLLLAVWPGHPPAAVFLNPINLEFGLGLLAAWLCQRLSGLSVARKDALGGLFLGLGMTGFIATSVALKGHPEAMDLWYRHPLPLLGYGLSSTALLLATLSARLEGFALSLRPLILIGNGSYAIYLVHLQFEKMASDLFKKLPILWQTDPGDPMRANLIFIGIATLSLMIGLIVHQLIEKPLVFGVLQQRIRKRFGS